MRESLEVFEKVDEVVEEENEFVVEVEMLLLRLVTGLVLHFADLFSNFFISFSNFRFSSFRLLEASLVFTIVSCRLKFLFSKLWMSFSFSFRTFLKALRSPLFF